MARKLVESRGATRLAVSSALYAGRGDSRQNWLRLKQRREPHPRVGRIRDPKLLDEGELLLYDRVIANPPFSLDEWGPDVAENDGYGRFRFGIPPRTKGDLAFVQHMVGVLNAAGRLGVVMPHGVLFRGSAEGKIRQGLLQEEPHGRRGQHPPRR